MNKVAGIREKYVKAITGSAARGFGDWRTDKALIGHGVCPFCGKIIKNAKRKVYCSACLNQGFDQVHQTFGSTNGWDKLPTRVVPVRNGVRGRMLTGVNARRRFE